MKGLNYFGAFAAAMVVIASVLGMIAELCGVKTSAVIAHGMAAAGWATLAIRDWNAARKS